MVITLPTNRGSILQINFTNNFFAVIQICWENFFLLQIHCWPIALLSLVDWGWGGDIWSNPEIFGKLDQCQQKGLNHVHISHNLQYVHPWKTPRYIADWVQMLICHDTPASIDNVLPPFSTENSGPHISQCCWISHEYTEIWTALPTANTIMSLWFHRDVNFYP